MWHKKWIRQGYNRPIKHIEKNYYPNSQKQKYLFKELQKFLNKLLIKNKQKITL